MSNAVSFLSSVPEAVNRSSCLEKGSGSLRAPVEGDGARCALLARS